MRRAARLLLLLIPCLLLTACGDQVAGGGRRGSEPVSPAPRNAAFVSAGARPAVLLVVEAEGPGGAAVASSAAALEVLLAHFDEACDTVTAQSYEGGKLSSYQSVFYFAGKPDQRARPLFAADVGRHNGLAVWVGPGISTLGAAFSALGLEEAEPNEPPADALDWTISYKGQRRVERISVPPVEAAGDSPVLVETRRANEARPFIAGKDRLWYAATGPALDRERFWTACVWADALHEMLGQPHAGAGRRLVPVLRDVPVWTTPEQVPKAIAPMRQAGVPVAVMAWTNWGQVPLADRPDAVEGLRKAESMGAVVVLVADTGLDPREHFRLAWEVGLHPVAWAGPSDGESPFKLRIADPEESPPYLAGGLLPTPITISDAGYIAPEDVERLGMLEAVRDAVALVSFGLWAPPGPFLDFVHNKQSSRWIVSDVRDFDVQVTDTRRVLISGAADLQATPGATVRQVFLSPSWRVATETLSAPVSGSVTTVKINAPDREAVMVELPKERSRQPFIKGVTLDPWAYSNAGLSGEELARTLAERYQRYGVNTVFFYAYNVNEGAAYRTRYRGASASDWGRQDLLAHVLDACHERNIRVVAWLYSGRDEEMWKKHPEWRERGRDGKPYNPLRLHAAYFMCPRNPEVREWYSGLLRDLAKRYPSLDGIELCEPVVNWFGDQACYCEVCRRDFENLYPGEPLGKKAWRDFRAKGLTDFLSGCIKAISEQGIDSYIMTISDAWSNGAILTPQRQAEESGFDLEALLDGPHPPDWMNFEIIWQQWAAIYGTQVFNYDWAERTARRLVRRTDGRANVLLHVELSDFGSQRMTPEKIVKTIRRVEATGPNGIECYHSRAVDSRNAWPELGQVYKELP